LVEVAVTTLGGTVFDFEIHLDCLWTSEEAESDSELESRMSSYFRFEPLSLCSLALEAAFAASCLALFASASILDFFCPASTSACLCWAATIWLFSKADFSADATLASARATLSTSTFTFSCAVLLVALKFFVSFFKYKISSLRRITSDCITHGPDTHELSQ
jgi:hypothetical protein